MKGRLLLGVAGILCALMVAALVVPVLTPHTQGSAAPQKRLVFDDDEQCTEMYGCTSQRVTCVGSCQIIVIGPITISWTECCAAGEDGGSCMYCDD